MNENQVELIFRDLATQATESGMLARRLAVLTVDQSKKISNRNFNDDTQIDFISSNLALSIEHFLKASIIYNDFRISPYFLKDKSILEIESLKGRITEALKKPKLIQDQIISRDNSRENIFTEDDANIRRSISGHDIYTYFQLQNPVIKALINYRYLTATDKEEGFSWIDYAILNDDLLKEDADGMIHLPQQQLEYLKQNKDNFAKDRYPYAHDSSRSTKVDDVNFLKEMSYELETIMDYLFPSKEEFRSLDFYHSKLESELKSDFISYYKPKGSIYKTLVRLDKMSQYHLKNDFSKSEFEALLTVITEINNDPRIETDKKALYRNIFVNISTFLKYYSMKSGVNFNFTEQTFRRIKRYCHVLTNETNAFKKDSPQLKNSFLFASHQEQFESKLDEIKKVGLLEKQIKSINAVGNEQIIRKLVEDKTPILLTGASKSSWPNISEKDQNQIKLIMQVLANTLNPNSVYIMTGGTNFGVEKQLHNAVYRRNCRENSQLDVVGTLTLEAVENGEMEMAENTITHAMIVEINGHKAQNWEDLPDVEVQFIKEKNGDIIAIGGGAVVKKMIEKGKELGTDMHLMKGPAGASTDCLVDEELNRDAFENASQLLMQLYQKNPNIFVESFSPNDIAKYCYNAILELKESNEISKSTATYFLEQMKSSLEHQKTESTHLDNDEDLSKKSTEQVISPNIIKKGIEDGLFPVIQAKKTGKCIARRGNLNEKVISWSVDESGSPIKEIERSVEVDPITNNLGWIVTKCDDNGNPIVDNNNHLNQWIVPDSKFIEKYEQCLDQNGVYKPKEVTQSFIQTLSDVILINPNNTSYKVAAGGFINVTDKEDMYVVSARDFADTYTIVSEDKLQGSKR